MPSDQGNDPITTLTPTTTLTSCDEHGRVDLKGRDPLNSNHTNHNITANNMTGTDTLSEGGLQDSFCEDTTHCSQSNALGLVDLQDGPMLNKRGSQLSDTQQPSHINNNCTVSMELLYITSSFDKFA